MIKKISAIILALVLCLSVVVVPASSLELGDAQLAFELKWDKEYYSAGDTAVLSVYMDAADDLSLYTGSFAIGLNSAVISQEDNDLDTVRANSVTNDPFGTLYKPAESNLSWLAATVSPKVDAANTAEEQALYDHYLKFTAAKNASGSHENAANNKDGFYGSDFDPSEPIMQITFKVAAGVADGTPINAAITSGTKLATPTQTAWKYYKTPGTGSTTGNIAAADIDLSQAVATATVGEPEPAGPSFVIAQGKDAIRFNKDGDAYKNISIRTSAEIALADLQTACKGATENDAIEDFIVEAGFVYIPATETFSVDAAKAAITAITEDEGESNGYTKKMVSYIQNTGSAYKYTCVVDIEDNQIASAAFNTFAYIILDYDNDGTADETCYYEAENSISAKTLYNAKVNQANSTYGWTLAKK